MPHASKKVIMEVIACFKRIPPCNKVMNSTSGIDFLRGNEFPEFYTFFSAGIVKKNVLPFPSSDSTHILPL
jgi:hypothetical protein